MKKKILVVDIGGTNVKLLMSPTDQRKFASGGSLGPRQFVSKLKQNVEGWRFDAISIGFPSVVRNGKILRDPKHLGSGWRGFNFARALKKPTQVINDAAMQALGSYYGKRMLFLGLGTGLGSALVWENNLLPLELSDLPYRNGEVIEKSTGQPALDKWGEKKWKREVEYAAMQLKKAFIADYVVLGGGNARFFQKLPAGFEHGHNRNAYRGGVRLWEVEPGTRKKTWHVI